MAKNIYKYFCTAILTAAVFTAACSQSSDIETEDIDLTTIESIYKNDNINSDTNIILEDIEIPLDEIFVNDKSNVEFKDNTKLNYHTFNLAAGELALEQAAYLNGSMLLIEMKLF